MRTLSIKIGIACVLATVLAGCGLRLPDADCASLPAQPMTLEGAESFTYAATGTRDLRIHVFRPAEDVASRPAILLFVGGGWRTGQVDSMTPQAKAFAARGYIAVIPDYRVKCRDGTTPRESVEDAGRALRWLRTHARGLGVDSDRIVLGGASAGGHLALVAAMRAPDAERPAGLVLFNPIVDMVAESPPWGGAAARDISPAALPAGSLPPTFIVHGQEDRRTPIARIRAFCDRARAAGRRCTLKEYPGEGHSFFTRLDVAPGKSLSPYEETLTTALAFADSVIGQTTARRNP